CFSVHKHYHRCRRTEIGHYSRAGRGIATHADGKRKNRRSRRACDRANRRRSASGTPHRSAICRSPFCRKFIRRLRLGTRIVRYNVDIVLTGSIRDEGPLPGVTTDAIEAQKVMREKLTDVTHALLLATLQHSLAVASMLAPTVKTVCVDIDPSTVEKAVEHQPLQSIGLVTDVEPFLRELGDHLGGSRVGE